MLAIALLASRNTPARTCWHLGIELGERFQGVVGGKE